MTVCLTLRFLLHRFAVGLDPWPARLLFVLILLILPGSQILIYPVLWILMPNEAPTAQFLPVTDEKQTASAA